MSGARIATVTGVSPYQVQLLGESVPLNLTPVVLSTVNIGDFVWCDFYDQQLVVLGRIEDGSVPQLGSSENLNDFVYTGTWNQPLNANTDTARNYPDTWAGFLEVFRAKPDGSMVHQRYSIYNTLQTWWRTYYSATGWNAWVSLGGSRKDAITLASGLTIRSGYGLSVARVGNRMAVINGQVQNTSGATITGGNFANAGGFPVWARPASGVTQAVPIIGNNVQSTADAPSLEIHSDGSASMFGISVAASGFLGVAGTYFTA